MGTRKQVSVGSGRRGTSLERGWSGSLLWPNRMLPLQTGQLEPLLLGFTEKEEQQMMRLLQRMGVLAKVVGLGCAWACVCVGVGTCLT